MQITEVTIGPGGWVRFWELDPPITVTFREAEDGRLEPIGVVVNDATTTLSNRVLSEVPFGRLEAIANLDPIAEQIKLSLSDASYRDQTWEIPDDLAGGFTAADVLLELIELGELDPEWSGHHSERFYQLIAALYQWATYHYPDRPAAHMSELIRIPVGTVRRWVMVARSDKYGFLPKARVGKEG